jgi:putative transcriptional regulator
MYVGKQLYFLFLEKGKYNPSLKLAYDVSRALKSKIEEVFMFDE